jgi:uncharacterized membrane protein
MTQLIAGLLIVLGVHSVRLFADDWRSRTLARIGRPAWLTLYSLVSLLGLALLVGGFAQVREQPLALWSPPVATRHLAALLMLPAFVLWAAALVPGNRIKARLHHPLVLGVKIWALAHLLATGTLAHALLFGSLLAWSVLSFRAARLRDQREATPYPAGMLGPTLATGVLGVLGWLLFAHWLHGLLMGIRPVNWL